MNYRPTLGQLKPPPIAILIAVAVLAIPASASGQTAVVSGTPSVYTDNYSAEPSVSANGRVVAFSSEATNLSEADGDGVVDVFARDMREETFALMSRANGIDGAGSQYPSSDPSISADGRFVAFDSDENGLSDEDGPYTDVFVRDLQKGTTTLVSRASGVTGAGGDSNSDSPSISADGRYVAFESDADNFDQDASDYTNIFLRDMKRNRTILVSRRSGADGRGGTGGSSDNPSISADGMRVAFESGANNLSGADDNDYLNVFVRDLETGNTTLVSRGSGSGPGGNFDSFEPAISANGRAVAFTSAALNLARAGADAYLDVHVRDLETQETILASRRSGRRGAAANLHAVNPSISGGGRFVAFESDAYNLSGEDEDAYSDVFVRDLKRAKTSLASRASEGEAGDGDSGAPAISANGSVVAFESEASNLSPFDADGIPDVFIRDLRAPEA